MPGRLFYAAAGVFKQEFSALEFSRLLNEWFDHCDKTMLF